MKKIFSILTIALFATIMVSCDKEDVKNNASNGGTQLNIPANTLIYDGTSYTFDIVDVDYYHSELTLVSAETSEIVNEEPKLSIHGIHITPNAWNKTLDLSNASQWPEDVMVALHLSGELNISYESWNNGGQLGSWGEFNGEELENTSLFTSGTYRVSGNNDGTPITITYDCTLKNGKKLQIKLVTDNYDVHN